MTSPYAYVSGDPAALPIAALDFEASCLPTPLCESYPAEVGIAYVNGDVRSWLIRPTDEWLATGFWDSNSERIHGLSLDYLKREGQDVVTVRRELAEAAEGHVVVSDNPWHEETWAEVLYNGPPPFKIENYEAVLYDRAGLPMPAFREALGDAAKAALVRIPRLHRAGPDAQRLAETCQLLLRWGR